MSKYRIRYAQQAVDDLDAIFDYVLLEDQSAALKLLAEFERRIGSLAESPYVGAAIRTDEPMMIAAGYRYLVVPPYLVFYRVTDAEVRIGRVLHSRQDWLQLLFGPR